MRAVDSSRWVQLSALLDELLLLDAGARDLRLAQLEQDDAALAGELRALLAQQVAIERERFLDGSALDGADQPLAGQPIGAYTLERPLGAGGMGSVWLARRSDGRYEGKVAVKLLNLALLARGGPQRFAREGSVLARLAHPNIARLLDAGITADGQPYLVLEHVEGEPIDRWCDARSLAINARVRLVQDVLAAVAHAHSKLVLHRDVKPDNILVSHDGQVKLLDFGIAKLLDDEALPAQATELTQLAGRPFTPDYAAPEQVEGGEVTTATDVYALGVLLYVLLGGVHPTAKDADTPLERLRSVVATEPPRLSDAAAQNDTAAASRGETTLPQLAGALRGDLDNIVAKALKKAPADRYPTAAAFADDLRRYLDHEPVGARADSLGYRSAKFVRRHRLAAGAASATVLALVAGVIGTTWQAVEAQRQRADALQQRDRAQALLGRNEAIVDFIDMMFTEGLPAGQAAAIQQMLERSERLVAAAFVGQPAHQAEILRVLASYYTGLDLPNKQFELLTRAREIVERNPDRSLQAQLACAHAATLSKLGKGDEAIGILLQWLGAPDIEAGVAASCLQTRAVLAQNGVDADAALRHAEAGLQRLRESGTAAPRLEATLLGDVGFAHHLAGRNDEAERAYQRALERLRELGRPDSPDALRMTIDRGVVRYAMGDFKGGLEVFERALQIAQGMRGSAAIPPAVLGNQAFGLEQLGRYEEALAGYDRTLDAAQRSGFVGGKAYALVGRATVLAALGRTQPAQASLDDAAALLAELPAAHPARVRHTLVQARIDAARGDSAAAGERFTSVIDLLSGQGLKHPALASAYRQRAELARQRGDAAPAMADARKALELARALQGGNRHSDLTGLAWLTLGRVLLAAGDAEHAREAGSAAHAELLNTLGADHPDTRSASELLGDR